MVQVFQHLEAGGSMEVLEDALVVVSQGQVGGRHLQEVVVHARMAHVMSRGGDHAHREVQDR